MILTASLRNPMEMRMPSSMEALSHPDWLAPGSTCILALVTKLLFNAHKLVVLCIAVRSARSPCFDLPCAQTNGKVCDGGVLSLTTAVRAHHTPAALLAHLHCSNGFRHCANLVHLQQQSVACLVVDGLLHPCNIGHGEIVANNLSGPANLLCESCPGSPVILIERIFDGDERIVVAKARVEVCQHSACHLQLGGLLGLSVPSSQVVAVLVLNLELRCSHVHADLANILVASFFDGLHDEFHTLFGIAGRCKATLVSDQGGIASELFLDDALQVVIAFSANANGFLEGSCTDRDDEVLLKSKLIACVGATIDDVEARNRQSELPIVAGELSEVLVEGNSLGLGAGFCCSHGDSEDGVGSKLALVGGAIKVNHLLIKLRLLAHIKAFELLVQNRIHGFHSLGHTLAQVAGLVAISQLTGFVDACGSARWNCCNGLQASLCEEIHFNGWVTAAVEDLTGLQLFDLEEVSRNLVNGSLQVACARGLERFQDCLCHTQ
mmetsp:Transcript_10019/g.17957  ORF Transcript_10019/g.17957 Transcript_10019/m.17957 type:complete len:494 (+) Transcript_10019:288-1769(+)